MRKDLKTWEDDLFNNEVNIVNVCVPAMILYGDNDEVVNISNADIITI